MIVYTERRSFRCVLTWISGFRNPLDEKDLAFELPPNGSPVIQLEFPNTGSIEEYVIS